MGLFCASIHVRSNDASAVRAAVDPTAVVLESKAGWVSLYLPDLLERGEPAILDRAGSVSQRLETRTVSFWVYDSDIACYWLHESGNVIDRHNSWPDYFDDDSTEIAVGDPDTLATFCREGTRVEDLEQLLAADAVFAEDMVAGIATAIGISQSRALRDYRDEAEGPADTGLDVGDLGGLREVLTGGASVVPASESAVALVTAAVSGEVAELRRLVASGAPLDEEAPAPLPGGQSLAGLGMAIPSEIPALSMTPLIAAIAHGQHDAVAALLELGADPNRQHELYGSAVHAAAGAGNPTLLTTVLDAGGSPHVRNRQGHSPLQVLSASRQQLDLLEQAKSPLGSLGAATPDFIDQLGPSDDLTGGWDACEEILRSRGAASD